jgi:hypothetical protein
MAVVRSVDEQRRDLLVPESSQTGQPTAVEDVYDLVGRTTFRDEVAAAARGIMVAEIAVIARALPMCRRAPACRERCLLWTRTRLADDCSRCGMG